MSEQTGSRAATGGDLTRQIAVTAAEVFCVFGSLLGSGVLGGPKVAEAAGGALSAEATLLAPGGGAFVIWSLIYLGLAGYTVWQWLPGQRTAERHRAVGWWIAASMVLNAGWLLAVRAGWLWVSVAVIVALVLCLGQTLVLLHRHRPTSVLDQVFTDATVGVYTGWVAVATCANVAAVLVDAGVTASADWAQGWAVLVLVVAGGVGLAVAWASGANLGVAAAMAWGLCWIAAQRVNGAPESTVTAVAAVAVAVAVVAGTFAVRLRSGDSGRTGVRVV